MAANAAEAFNSASFNPGHTKGLALLDSAQGGPAGENIASASPPKADMATWAVYQWYIEWMNCNSFPGCNASSNGLKTGHFTALVWKESTHIGCVISANREVAACRYGPGPDGQPSCNTIPNVRIPGCYQRNVLAGNDSSIPIAPGCPGGPDLTLSPTFAPTAATPAGAPCQCCVDAYATDQCKAYIAQAGMGICSSNADFARACAKSCETCPREPECPVSPPDVYPSLCPGYKAYCSAPAAAAACPTTCHKCF